MRVFFDTNAENNGPEYNVAWTIGKSPAGDVGGFSLVAMDTWEVDGQGR